MRSNMFVPTLKAYKAVKRRRAVLLLVMRSGVLRPAAEVEEGAQGGNTEADDGIASVFDGASDHGGDVTSSSCVSSASDVDDASDADGDVTSTG